MLLQTQVLGQVARAQLVAPKTKKTHYSTMLESLDSGSSKPDSLVQSKHLKPTHRAHPPDPARSTKRIPGALRALGEVVLIAQDFSALRCIKEES